jgi:hypothetical protein
MRRHEGIRAGYPKRPLPRTRFAPIRAQRRGLSRQCGTDEEHCGGRHRYFTTIHSHSSLATRLDAAGPSAACPSWRCAAEPSAACPSWRHAAEPSAACPSWRHAAEPSAVYPSQQHAAEPSAVYPSQQHAAEPSAVCPSQQHAAEPSAVCPSRRKRNWRLRSRRPKRLD